MDKIVSADIIFVDVDDDGDDDDDGIANHSFAVGNIVDDMTMMVIFE